MHRRNFLRTLGYGAVGTAGVSALTGLQHMVAAATSEDYRAVVCLFMFGGNDANNMLVPYDADAQGYSLYAKGRTPVLALPRDQLLPVTLAGTNGRSFALHPAMAGLQGLINQGKAAVVANVGTLTAPLTLTQWNNGAQRPPNLFSHSDQQNEWQTGTPDGSMKSGWGGRLAEMTAAANGANALYATLSVSGNALYLNGNNSVAYKVSPSGTFGFDFYDPNNTGDSLSVGVTEMLNSQRTHVMEQAWLGTIDRSIQNQKVLNSALNSVSATATFPNSDLGNQLKMITRLIAARSTLGLKRQAFFASIGGFDTHGDDQLTRQNQLLGDVSASVAAFQNALVQLGISENVTLFTASDFNRTFPSNGKGSDHAWGSHHFVVGGSVKGGQLLGSFPDITVGGADDVGNGQFIPSTSVDQMAASIAAWFGVSNTDLDTLFPLLGRYATRTLPMFV